MHGVFSSVRNLLSVTVLMCAAFIFALLMAYQRYNDGLAPGGLHRCADGRRNFSGFLMKVNSAEGGYMSPVFG